MIKSKILVPLLNANEPEARVVGIHVKDKQAVGRGTLLFTIETTKASLDIESPEPGFVKLMVNTGEILPVGEKLAVIVDFQDEVVSLSKITSSSSKSLQPSLRITKPARALAESLGLDLASLPTNQLVTVETVRKIAAISVTSIPQLPVSDKPYILVFGAGGHAKAIMDMIKLIGSYSIVGILDDDGFLTGNVVLGIPVLGTRALVATLAQKGVKFAANGVGGIIDISIRVKIFTLLENSGFTLPVLIHPRATVEPSAKVGKGVQVFANAYIGSDAILHPKCMINTNAVVSHDCEIGSYTHIAPGALLAGHVHVGERSLIGMGVTTAIGVKIGSGVRIGNGAIVLADVPEKMVIQAGRYWVGKAE